MSRVEASYLELDVKEADPPLPDEEKGPGTVNVVGGLVSDFAISCTGSLIGFILLISDDLLLLFS